MSKAGAVVVIILLVLAAGAGYLSMRVSQSTLSSTEDAAVRTLVGEWREASSSAQHQERIDVVTIEKTAPGAFKVEANLVKLEPYASTTRAVAVYPLTLWIEERGGTLVVVSVDQGPFSELPRPQTVVGFWECLPHKDASGPQTMECAIGIKKEGSTEHYALNLNLLETAPAIDYPTGTKLRIEGVVTPVEQLSSNYWQKYDVVGVLSATTIEKTK